MSSIPTSTISSLEAIKTFIDDTSDKILHPNSNNLSERIAIENNVDKSNANAGVQIKRKYDNYNNVLDEEERKTNEHIHDDETRVEEYLKLENLFNEKKYIFNQLIEKLYSSIKENIVNKNSNVFNEEIIENFKNVVDELKIFNQKLTFLEYNIKNNISKKIHEVNSLINQIYKLNNDINYFPVKEVPEGIHKYINTRDELITKLNNIIGIRVIKDKNTFKVCLNNGMCIIDEDKKINLIPLFSNYDDKYISVGYFDQNEQIVKKMEHMIPSGVLGALFLFRRKELQNARNKLGQLTVNFADSINEYHTSGYDISGNNGQPIFNIIKPDIAPSINNKQHHDTFIRWVSTSNAQDTNYMISRNDRHWTVIRIKDQSRCDIETYQEGNQTYIKFDGIEVGIQGSSDEGDMYIVKPYAKTLDKLELLITKDTPFASSSTEDISQHNKNNAIIIYNLDKDKLVYKKETLSQSYSNFLKSIYKKCHDIREKIPFKYQVLKIIQNQKSSMLGNKNENYEKLTYQQKCYSANFKLLKIAESIFNDIINCCS